MAFKQKLLFPVLLQIKTIFENKNLLTKKYIKKLLYFFEDILQTKLRRWLNVFTSNMITAMKSLFNVGNFKGYFLSKVLKYILDISNAEALKNIDE